MDRTLSAELLTPKERIALEKARQTRISYGVRMYACPGPDRRLLVVLGETHLKLEPAWLLGKEIVSHFALRGVETFQRRQVVAGTALGMLINAPRLVLRALSLGLVKGSTITDAKALPTGTTVELEKAPSIPLALHVASVYLTVLFSVLWTNFVLTVLRGIDPELGGDGLGALIGWLTMLLLALEVHFLLLVPALLLRTRRWSWMIHPAVGLIATRDILMAEGTVRMLAEHPDAATAVVVMGRAHLPGFQRELIENHAFRRVEF